MLIGISIGDYAEGISNGEIVIKTFSALKSSCVSNDIAVVLLFYDYIIPNAWGSFLRFAVAYPSEILCHWLLLKRRIQDA